MRVSRVGCKKQWVTDIEEHHLDGEWTYLSSPSPYGTFDQAGNVAEWTETLVSSTSPVYRGGDYTHDASESSSLTRFTYLQTIYPNYVGFRVATFVVPEPTTLLLSIAVFAALPTRRRKPTSHNRV
jgi:sulfatase modifying factor 1